SKSLNTTVEPVLLAIVLPFFNKLTLAESISPVISVTFTVRSWDFGKRSQATRNNRVNKIKVIK
ncbi:MAG TPA: hypothetical protein PLF82_10210, partial [Halanaerobiales bacterium]|nr:hypothetical protein [Halanaerobiales bacterium]